VSTPSEELAAHPVAPRSNAELAAEWDTLAEERSRDTYSGTDLSFSRVLLPTVLDMVSALKAKTVLDVGSGTGALTKQLSLMFPDVTGVDASPVSVAIARQAAPSVGEGLRFVHSTIEEFAPDVAQFDLAIANMVLMDTADLTATLSAIARLLRPGGAFIWTITHPWFWPKYWGYQDEPWFRYDRELFIESTFRTSTATSAHTSTHVHRPLARYFRELLDLGFTVDDVREPIPTGADMDRYPEDWLYPRFIAVRCRMAERTVHSHGSG